MGCKVSYVPLGELAEFESGGTPSKKIESYWGGSIPWISAKTLVGDTVYESDLTISKEGLESGSKLASKGSLLLLTRGSGLFKRIPLAIAGIQVAYNQDIKCISANAKGISNRYLFYALKALEPAISAMLETTGIGAGKLATDRLKALPIPVLAEDARAKVTSFADCIYGKISLNAKLNGYLAEQCEGIAEHQTGDVVALASLCGLASERVDCREADIATYVSTESLLPAKMGKQTASTLPQAGKVAVYKAGDTLVSNIRPYFKKIWYADRSGTCSGDVLVFRANQPEHAGYLYSCLRQDRFFDYVMKGAKGTKMPRGDKKQMLTYEIVNSPSAAAIGAIQTALEQISIANKENDSLAALRDALLPKLMSGEIDVSKVDLTQLNSHLSKCSSGSCCILPVMAALPATK